MNCRYAAISMTCMVSVSTHATAAVALPSSPADTDVQAAICQSVVGTTLENHEATIKAYAGSAQDVIIMEQRCLLYAQEAIDALRTATKQALQAPSAKGDNSAIIKANSDAMLCRTLLQKDLAGPEGAGLQAYLKGSDLSAEGQLDLSINCVMYSLGYSYALKHIND